MVSVVCYELVGDSGIQIQLHGKPVSIALQYFPSLEVENVHMQPSAVNSQTHRFGHRHGSTIRLETFKKSDAEQLMLTQHASEPYGQVLLHGHQRGLVPHCQPLVILEDVCEAGAVPLH